MAQPTPQNQSPRRTGRRPRRRSELNYNYRGAKQAGFFKRTINWWIAGGISGGGIGLGLSDFLF